MKKLLLIVVFIMSLVMISFAQTPTPTPTQSQPSAEDIKQAKENLKVLLSDGQPTPTKDNKSVADVMDKGLDMLSGYVGTLEGVVSKYAPEVWRVMIMQQYAKAISYPLYWGLLLLSIIIFQRVMKSWLGYDKTVKVFKMTPDEENESSSYHMADSFILRCWLAGVVPIVLAIPTTVFFLYYLTEGVMVAINPEYYALKDIIQMLK